MKAPSKCPLCKEKKKWVKIDKRKQQSINLAGAVVGYALKGPIGGLIGAGTGKSKKYEQWACGNCGFSHEYEA